MKKKKDDKEHKESLAALGILLLATGAVAEADGDFSPKEQNRINNILLKNLKISKDDAKVVTATIMQTAVSKVDYSRAAIAASRYLSRNAKISIIEDLFRVAYIDKGLDPRELKVIRKVSALFDLSKKDLTEIQDNIVRETGPELLEEK